MYVPKGKQEAFGKQKTEVHTMKANYNVTGAARKALVSAISNITGDKALYKLMPTCAYEIGNITVGELNAGDFFGEMSLIDGSPRSATITAADTLLLFAINEKNFERIIAWEPLVAVRIMKSLSRRLRELNEEIKNAFSQG